MKRKGLEIKDQILAAALKRFLQIGYGKTTMIELGEGCQLSPAHLYNFFPGKLDIAAAIMDQEIRKQADHLSEFLDGELRAAQILPLYFMEELTLHYKIQRDNPGMPGLLALVRKKRPLMVHEFSRRFTKNLSLYLSSRMQKGEIVQQDAYRMAEMLQNATFPFRNLNFPVEYSLDDMKRQLDDIIRALLRGVVVGGGA